LLKRHARSRRTKKGALESRVDDTCNGGQNDNTTQKPSNNKKEFGSLVPHHRATRGLKQRPKREQVVTVQNPQNRPTGAVEGSTASLQLKYFKICDSSIPLSVGWAVRVQLMDSRL
jgi:hypothetical protein